MADAELEVSHSNVDEVSNENLQKLEEKAKKAEEAFAKEEKLRKELETLNSKLLAEKTALLDSLSGEKGQLSEFQEKCAKLTAQKNDLDNQLRVSIDENISREFFSSSRARIYLLLSVRNDENIYFHLLFQHTTSNRSSSRCIFAERLRVANESCGCAICWKISRIFLCVRCYRIYHFCFAINRTPKNACRRRKMPAINYSKRRRSWNRKCRA